MKPVVVACSAGIDSMALLDQVAKKHSVVVAHVNYKKRKSADDDQQILESYCKEKQIPIFVMNAKEPTGNFQSWARDVRYDFFEQVAKKVGADTIYVAHHMDDCIETYLFQKQTNRLCQQYGIGELTSRKGMKICRPFLRKEKKELEQYCMDHHVPVGCDETNFEDAYTRNQIRHQVVEKMSKEQKQAMMDEIDRENQKLFNRRTQAVKLLEQPFQVWKKEQDAWFILDTFLSQITHRHYGKKYLIDLLKQLEKPHCIQVDNYWLENYQGYLLCEKESSPIHRVFHSIIFGDYERFSLNKSGKIIESIKVTDKDFPLTIRNVKDGDAIQLRMGTKSIHRFFIDRKISHIERKKWLVVTNAKNEVIFVPGIGCDINHFSEKPSVFMVQ